MSSILGVVVRAHPSDLPALHARLTALPGCTLGPDAGDGRLVAVLEDAASQPAAATMSDVAQWPEVLNLSLVYEHTEPAPAHQAAPALDYRGWRESVGDFARVHAGSPRA